MRRLGEVRWLLAILAFSPAVVWSQFSPGALSKAHSSLEGPTRCTSCHVGAGGNRRFRCLSCHTEIRRRLTARRGLHPTLLGANQGDDVCFKCHSEHNGTGFVPIRWDVSLEDFDHRKTGYPLEGGHAGMDCKRCHNPQRISRPARSEIRVKDLSRTYLGLTRECLGCHEDEHGGQLAANCERCHTYARWKDVPRFDHARAKFLLTGAHQRVACQKCHPPVQVAGRAKPRTKFTGVGFSLCTSCHQDPHRGAFPAPCNSCHSESAWKPARNLTSSFDHSKTKFPLLGKHNGVACDKCHRTTDFSAPVPHAQCRSCHKDIHGGQFTARSDGGDCGSCHTVEGWKPTSFTVASHARTGYPLTGRHAAVACAACHKPAGPQTVYRVPRELCTNCHKDQHDGQFASSFQNRCETCHTTEGYSPVTFTLARHNQTRFPLQGSHLAVACVDCHKKPLEHRAGVFHFSGLSCNACHPDPHQWGSSANTTATNAGSRLQCETCHTDRSWREVSKFDHSATRFALTGAHRALLCRRCHSPATLSAGVSKIVFRDTPLACAGCHQDIHGGQFSTATGPPGCDVCHNTDKWKPSRFDHERTSFPLAGAHAGVGCLECHQKRTEVNGRKVLLYKPTPKDCAGCHGLAIPQ